MAFNISDVVVGKISLVSKEETPAVPKAGFKLFKMFSKSKISKNLECKLDNLAERLSK